MRALVMALRCEKGDVDANLARHRELIADGARRGCDLVLFPEMSLTGSARAALTIDAPPVLAVAGASREHGVAVVFGIIEWLGAGGRSITQVAVVDGAVVAVQRKRHLGEGEEGFVECADHGAAVARVANASAAMAICAESDVDFPFDAAATAGARLICFAAAPGLYGRRADEASWRDGFDWWRGKCMAELPAHAWRTGCPILVSSQAGSTVDEDFPGWAASIDASGRVAAELPDWHEATLVVDVAID